jgi:hypothetical protein
MLRLGLLHRHLSATKRLCTMAFHRRVITTAGCLVIGDEVLSSKTMDTNSAHFGIHSPTFEFPPLTSEMVLRDRGGLEAH